MISLAAFDSNAGMTSVFATTLDLQVQENGSAVLSGDHAATGQP